MTYVRVFLLRLVCCVAVLAGAVWAVDPYGNHGLGWFPVVLQDDHIPKLPLLTGFARQGAVSGLIFGSSRCLILDPHQLDQATGLRWFNFAVSDSSFARMRSFYREAHDLGIRPRRVLVGVDPDRLVGRRNVDSRVDAAARGELVPSLLQSVQDFKALFTLDVIGDTCRSVAARAGILHPKPHNLFAADGGFRDRGDLAANDPGQETMTKTCAEDYRNRFLKDDSIHEAAMQALSDLVAEARADGAQVTLVVMPFNPAVSGFMMRDTRFPELRQQVVEQLAGSSSGLCDLTGAIGEGDDPADWTDCAHFGRRIGTRLLSILIASGYFR